MAIKKPVIGYLVIFAAALMLVKCANQLPPTGGDIDTIPPEIIEVYPVNGGINFDDDYISFTFSEYVDKRSVRDAVFISPSIDGELEYDWSGRTLEIDFPAELKANTTYTVTIGTDVKDINHGNNMAEAYTLIFSTGEKIDRGEISGKVYADNPQGTLIFAYRNNPDSVNFEETKPDYISQVGETGDYRLNGLAKGEYCVIAVLDQFRDLLYNKEEDSFGVPFMEIFLSEKDSILSGVNFFLAKEDTTVPHLFSAVMTDANHILIEFSEYIDSSKLTKDNFFVFDSTANARISIAAAFKGEAKSKMYFLSLTDTLNSMDDNFLHSSNIEDYSRNVLIEESTSLTVNAKPDTSAPEILRITTKAEGNKIDLVLPEIFVEFNDAVVLTDTQKAVQLFDKDSINVEMKINYLDDASFKVIPGIKLKSNSEYSLVVNSNFITDASGNRGDTINVKKLFTKNQLDYSGVFGVLKSGSLRNKVIVLQKLEDKKTQGLLKTAGVDSKGKFEFKKVIPGKYKIWAFADANGNSKYDSGKLKPFTLSEKFVYYPDTLNLRPRWPVGDVLINFDD